MSGFAGDQAEGLRRLLQRNQTRIIALASGKAHVGLSTVAVNLAWALAAQGQQVWIIDEGLGPDSSTARLGLQTHGELAQVLKGQMQLSQVLLHYCTALSLLPAREGLRRSAHLDDAQHARLACAYAQLNPQPDIVLLDLAADRTYFNFAAAAAADEILVLLAQEHAAITASYFLIKKLAQDYARNRFHVLLAKAKETSDAAGIYTNMAQAARRYLHAQLIGVPAIPWDEAVKRAQRLAKPVTEAYPDACCSLAYRALAQQIVHWPRTPERDSHLEGFLQRLIMSTRMLPNSAHA